MVTESAVSGKEQLAASERVTNPMPAFLCEAKENVFSFLHKQLLVGAESERTAHILP
jgi:hypothetical protein